MKPFAALRTTRNWQTPISTMESRYPFSMSALATELFLRSLPVSVPSLTFLPEIVTAA